MRICPPKDGTNPHIFFDHEHELFDCRRSRQAELKDAAPLGSAILALTTPTCRSCPGWIQHGLQLIVAGAFLARRIGCLDAFLLAFDQDGPTTARISCGSAHAVGALSMSTE